MGGGARVGEQPHGAAPTVTLVLRGEHEAFVTMTGELDGAAVQRLDAVFDGLCHAGARYLVIDLSGIGGIDHAARGLFVTLQRKLALNSGWMLLLDPPPLLADLDTVTLEVAFAAYRRAAASAGPAHPPPSVPGGPDGAPVVA